MKYFYDQFNIFDVDGRVLTSIGIIFLFNHTSNQLLVLLE